MSTEVISAAAAAKSLQSCLTLCNPIDGSPPGSPVPGILQARTLEWVAISFSNAWKWDKVKSLSRVRLLATLWNAAHQAPPSMGFSRQEYWSGVPLPSLEVISNYHEMTRKGKDGWCLNYLQFLKFYIANYHKQSQRQRTKWVKLFVTYMTNKKLIFLAIHWTKEK